MRGNNKVKKNFCTNLVQITDILEQTSITNKTHKLYTASTKNNINVPQDINLKLRTNILENTIPVCKDPNRNISHPKKNLYTIFTSKINKKTILSSKTIYISNSTNKPEPNTSPSVSLSSIPFKNHLRKFKDNNKINNTSQYTKRNQITTIKKHKLVQLSTPSQLKQTPDCVCLPTVKNIESRRKTRDATKKLFINSIAVARKNRDATEQIPNITTKRNNLQYPNGGISNEETFHNKYDVSAYGLAEDIGQNHHDVTSCQAYDKECVTKSIIENKITKQVDLSLIHISEPTRR